jgi:hypothetical protein
VTSGKVAVAEATTKPGNHKDSQIVAVHCLCGDHLKALYYHEDRQCQMIDTEVMTDAILARLYFRGNVEIACRILGDAV